jgi:hypothetical protein
MPRRRIPIGAKREVTMGVARCRKAIAVGFALAATPMASGASAAEASLSAYQGAWLAQGSSCADIFASAGQATSFKKPVDIFAPAFIISGSRLRTPMASCRIKSIKPIGDRQVLSLACANAVSVNDIKVLMSASPDGSLKRYFSDEDNVGSPYQRCSR